MNDYPPLSELLADGGKLLVTLALREMGREDYQAYLQTNHWQERRLARLRIARFRCEHCGANEALDVHHLTYKNLGDEPDEDLTALCDPCHNREHGLEAA